MLTHNSVCSSYGDPLGLKEVKFHFLADPRGMKTRQREKEVGRQHQGMDRPGVRQVPEGSGEQRKMEETGCEGIGQGEADPYS